MSPSLYNCLSFEAHDCRQKVPVTRRLKPRVSSSVAHFMKTIRQRSSTRPPSGTRSGFTLIELLVVIAIIGILASMLLPSLAGAKARAQETVCINNLRQAGLGIAMYIPDFDHRYPAAYVNDRNPATGASLGVKDVRPTLGGRTAGGQFAQAQSRPLFKYVPNANSFRCPMDKGGITDCLTPEGPASMWIAAGCSYRYNAGGLTKLSSPGTLRPETDPDEGVGGKSESWIPDPSTYIIVHEPPARPWGCSGSPPVWVQWHRAKGRTQFADPALAPTTFASATVFGDGHAAVLNFSRALTQDAYHPYEPTKEWTWYRTDR
jgi:prepilin-type N-terminal cleavage/methylation domain-containing protein